VRRYPIRTLQRLIAGSLVCLALGAASASAADPVIVAAGDIACDPANA
jgi:hypothetical protein